MQQSALSLIIPSMFHGLVVYEQQWRICSVVADGDTSHIFSTCIITEHNIVSTLHPCYGFGKSHIYVGPSHRTKYHIK